VIFIFIFIFILAEKRRSRISLMILEFPAGRPTEPAMQIAFQTVILDLHTWTSVRRMSLLSFATALFMSLICVNR